MPDTPDRTARRKLTPYQRIVRAAERGVGVRLSAAECEAMGRYDDAIIAVAAQDDHHDRTGERLHDE